MLTAYLFTNTSGEVVDDWTSAVVDLMPQHVLWIDLQGPPEGELAAVMYALGVDAERHDDLGRRNEPQVHLFDEYIHVVSVVAPGDRDQVSETGGVLDALVGENWVVTIHQSDSPLVDDFEEITTGNSQLGALDAPSFLATLLERVVLSYTEAFEEIAETLEDFDADVLRSRDADIDSKVEVLVNARQRVGDLRRSLSPHRRVYATLSHAELDRVSTTASAERFGRLASQVGDALGDARDAKEAVVSSFDMLILRTGNRTNEIVKVLTLTSILILPGALIAAILGMNVNLAGEEFATSGLFWGTIVAIIVIACATLLFARARKWI